MITAITIQPDKFFVLFSYSCLQISLILHGILSYSSASSTFTVSSSVVLFSLSHSPEWHVAAEQCSGVDPQYPVLEQLENLLASEQKRMGQR